MYESGENYLETILLLKESGRAVRSIDIAEQLSFARSSVSRAVNNLKKAGYINIDDDGYIEFSERGKEYAEMIYQRHTVITEFLQRLGIKKETADKDACRIEHVVSEETFFAIKEFLKKTK
jgi:Mn-dependent DtxR family transcriptional regulator